MREIRSTGEPGRKSTKPGEEQSKTELPKGHIEVGGESMVVRQLPEQDDLKTMVQESRKKTQEASSIEEIMKNLPKVLVKDQIHIPPERTIPQNVNPELGKTDKTDFPFLGGGDTKYIQQFGILYRGDEDFHKKMTITERIEAGILITKAEWSTGGVKTGLANMMAQELEKWDVQGGGGKKVNIDRQELANWLETVAINPPSQHDSEKRIEYEGKLSFIAFSLKTNKEVVQEWLKAIKKEYDEKHPNKASEKK